MSDGASTDDVQKRTLTLRNDKGLHVRAGKVLANVASRYQASVTVAHGGERANAKSVMNLLLLTAKAGHEVEVTTSGSDAAEAMEAVAHVFERGFREEDASDEATGGDAHGVQAPDGSEEQQA